VKLDVAVDGKGVGVGVVGGDDARRLQWHPGDAPPRVVALHDVVRVRERFVHVAELERLAVRHVRPEAVVDDGFVLAGVKRVHHRLQRLVAHVDEVHHVLRDVTVGRRDERNRLADEPHLVARQCPLLDAVQPAGHRLVVGGHVVAGQHEFAVRMVLRSSGVDRFDSRVWMRRPEERDVQAVLGRDVVDVLRLPREDAPVLHAVQARARELLAVSRPVVVGVRRPLRRS